MSSSVKDVRSSDARFVSGKIRLNVQPVELPDIIRAAVDFSLRRGKGGSTAR
jgi:hypothetical protein